jgi:tetratricopeptide (TPR) repeat protein
MKQLESLGETGASVTQLYFELGRSLQRELDALGARTDAPSQARYTQTRDAYIQFLKALAGSESGQTFDSLLFAAQSLLDVGQPAEALPVLDRLLTTYATDSDFLSRPDAESKLLLVRLRKARALYQGEQFIEAAALLDEVDRLRPDTLESSMERGQLLSAWAVKEPARWKDALALWTRVVKKLQRVRPPRPEYFEAVYQSALCLEALKRKPLAVSTLKAVMALSPSLGDPATKERYETLLRRLGR